MSPTSRPPEPSGLRPYRLGIYGGTFDPVHIGHLIIATQIQAALDLDRIVFVPAGVPPHKDPTQVTAAADRLAMLRLAVADNDAFGVDTLELDREGRSFTVDTLETFRERDPGVNLWFIMGGDSLAELHTWRDPGGIVSIARLAVASRPGWDIDVGAANRNVPATSARIDVIDTPLIEIASHEIRDRVRNGHSVRYLIPEAVREYLFVNGLYHETHRSEPIGS